MSRIEQNKNKLKNNIFLCRMKRVLRKKSRQKNMENLNQESIVGVQITDKKRNSVDRFFTHESAQKGYFESNSKPLNLSPNFRQTLSPNIKSSSKNSKHLQQVCSYMSQIAQIQKNRNNLSLIFSSTFHRPLWKSVQLRSPKKTYQSYIGKCAMFRQNQQEEAQIQFYNTNNIFILKKKINQKSEQTLQLPGPQIKPASIKYKKNQSYRLCTQIQPKQIATQRPNRVRSIKFKTKTDSIKNIESYITQREDPIHTRKTEQNRFVQGLYSLQPWNHMTDEQKLSLIRASPLVFH